MEKRQPVLEYHAPQPRRRRYDLLLNGIIILALLILLIMCLLPSRNS